MTDHLNPHHIYPDTQAAPELIENNGRHAVHLTVDEISSIIKTNLLNQEKPDVDFTINLRVVR